MQVYDKANLANAMDVDEEENASVTEEATQAPAPEEAEEELALEEEEEEAEAEVEEEVTAEDVLSNAQAAAEEAQQVAEQPIEPVAEGEARWDSEGALGLGGRVVETESRLGNSRPRRSRPLVRPDERGRICRLADSSRPARST